VAGGRVEYVQRLHALDLRTGQEKFGGPVTIQATVAGNRSGSDGQGRVSFNPLRQNQRAGLVLSNNVVYAAWASHGDNGPYNGWIMGYNAHTLRQVSALNITPDGVAGGIWQSGAAPAVDAGGNLYVSTGNDSRRPELRRQHFGVDPERVDDHRLVHAVRPGPFERGGPRPGLNRRGPPARPAGHGHPRLAIASDKQGTIYLLDRDRLRYQPRDAIVQRFRPLAGYGDPAFYRNVAYFLDAYPAAKPHPKAFRLSGDALSTTPTFENAGGTYGFPGATPSISADDQRGGIVWAIDGGGARKVLPAVLHAYDASNLNELYNSRQTGDRDQPGPAVKFTVPTVAYGHVYVGSQYNVTVYGLLKGVTAPRAPSQVSVRALHSRLRVTWNDNAGNESGFAGAVRRRRFDLSSGHPLNPTSTFDRRVGAFHLHVYRAFSTRSIAPRPTRWPAASRWTPVGVARSASSRNKRR
ncbi:MAG: hypothetical protein WKF75_11805, partial [Singulisphaera sp.]